MKTNRLWLWAVVAVADDRMFSCHHTELVKTLVRLSFALQMSLTSKFVPCLVFVYSMSAHSYTYALICFPSPDKPVSKEDSPSAVHASLKQRVQEIIQEAMTLPNLRVSENIVFNSEFQTVMKINFRISQSF